MPSEPQPPLPRKEVRFAGVESGGQGEDELPSPAAKGSAGPVKTLEAHEQQHDSMSATAEERLEAMEQQLADVERRLVRIKGHLPAKERERRQKQHIAGTDGCSE